MRLVSWRDGLTEDLLEDERKCVNKNLKGVETRGEQSQIFDPKHIVGSTIGYPKIGIYDIRYPI